VPDCHSSESGIGAGDEAQANGSNKASHWGERRSSDVSIGGNDVSKAKPDELQRKRAPASADDAVSACLCAVRHASEAVKALRWKRRASGGEPGRPHCPATLLPGRRRTLLVRRMVRRRGPTAWPHSQPATGKARMHRLVLPSVYQERTGPSLLMPAPQLYHGSPSNLLVHQGKLLTWQGEPLVHHGKHKLLTWQGEPQVHQGKLLTWQGEPLVHLGRGVKWRQHLQRRHRRYLLRCRRGKCAPSSLCLRSRT